MPRHIGPNPNNGRILRNISSSRFCFERERNHRSNGGSGDHYVVGGNFEYGAVGPRI